MTPAEIRALVRRCEALGRCPLGAAVGEGERKPWVAKSLLDNLHIDLVEAEQIACDWDGGETGRPAHVRSMRRAIAAGLGPRIVAGLERLEKGGSDG